MIRYLQYLLIAAAFFGFANHSAAQYTFFSPKGSAAIEVSLQGTGMLRLPIYRNSIASLAVVGDYAIGATKADNGLAPFLFTASISKQEMVSIKDLDAVLKGQASIQSGFYKHSDGSLFAGTLTTANNQSNGGHLLSIQLRSDGSLQVKDLGVPVKGEGIFALTGNRTNGVLYGITYPSGIFFSYQISNAAIKTYESIKPSKEDLDVMKREYHQTPDDYLCGALVVDDKGMVYGSRAINTLFYFNPSDESFNDIGALPEVWGRRTLGRVEAWTKLNGKLYGGNAGDGQLFEVDPEKHTVKNLGKPAMMPRLRGLCAGADGKIYGLTGALPGYVHLFAYDPAGAGFTDYGNPQFTMKAPGIQQGIEWRGFQLRTIAASEDGRYIVMGEDESLSQLMFFPVNQ